MNLKKIALFVGIIVLILGCYFISIYSFSLNEKVVGSIQVRENGLEGIELSKEEITYLVSELNNLNFKILIKTLRPQQMPKVMNLLKKSLVSLCAIKKEKN